jgi:phosphatidate cytidylyltransferase
MVKLFGKYPLTTFLKRVLTSIVLGAGFWTLFAYLPPIYFSLVLLAILSVIIVFEWKNFFNIHKLSYWLIMPFYPILPFMLLIIMNQNPLYHSLLFILFIVVFSFDTGSYMVGAFLGHHKLAPSVSPGKTWEGALGGWIFACIGLILVLWELNKTASLWFIAIFSLFACSLSLAGDLFESWLKRRAGIKDSGTMLPGHGGFLDRFDGILFTVFFFYMFRSYLVALFGL